LDANSPVSDTDQLRATDMNALAPYNYPFPPHNNNNNNNNNNNPFSNFGNSTNYTQSQPQVPGAGTGNGPMSPRSTAAAASAFNLDPSILQTTIGSLLQSPAAAQLFLNSLNNSVQGQSLNTPHPVPTNQPSFPFPGQANDAQGLGQSQQQTNPQQFLNGTNTNTANLNNQGQNNQELDPTLALFTPLPNHDGLMNHSENLVKSYQGAAGMNQDVDKLQESIDSLVRSMGLEPSQNGNGNGNMGQDQQQMGIDNNGFDDMGMGMGMGGEGFDNNFDVDQFLTELAKSEKQIQEETKAQGGQ
jgi:heat shock transcription factor